MANRFKGLDLLDRVPEELSTEVHDTIQKVGDQTIPKKKKGKMAAEKALQIAEKAKEKRKIYLSECRIQRIARRDKKAFLSHQCKEREEKNGIQKTRDLFKEIRDTKGIFHAMMGTIKDRGCMDLTEAQDIKTRQQEYTKEILITQMTTMF